MDNNIVEPNESFEFNKLSLGHPTSVQGGSYFTKIQYNSRPLYIQTIKSLTRQGFVKSGKKYYCDLMFEKGSEQLIHWFETLEETCQKLIHAKADTWFQNPLELNDIESAFNSTIRIYKSGKFYLVRANVKNNASGEPSLKIYNEDETTLSIHDVTPETEIICILEIQGIKFTSKNFQIEIEIKQAMVIHDEPIFESCLIKTNKKANKALIKDDENEIQLAESANLGKIMLETKEEEKKEEQEKAEQEKAEEKDNNKEEEKEKEKEKEKDKEKEKEKEEEEEEEEDEDDYDFDDDEVEYKESLVINDDENVDTNDLGILDLDLDEKKEEENLKEIDVGNMEDENLETVKLKKPNEVYFEMYREAREKAKQAKKAAILAYLAAKNIKKTYMLDNLNDDSENEFDAEIEEVTESELEGL